MIWCSPILFIGIFYIFKNFRSPSYLLVFLCYGQLFYIVHLWQSVGIFIWIQILISSLIPLGFLLFFVNYKGFGFEKKYIYVFSIFSILCILFFETTLLTQLSMEKELNSFGKNALYVEPNYVKGVVTSLLEIDSYLIIFSTSLFGALVFKLGLILFGKEGLVGLFEKLSLPTNNSDFQQLLSNLELIPLINLLVTSLFLLIISFYVVYKIDDKNNNF